MTKSAWYTHSHTRTIRPVRSQTRAAHAYTNKMVTCIGYNHLSYLNSRTCSWLYLDYTFIRKTKTILIRPTFNNKSLCVSLCRCWWGTEWEIWILKELYLGDQTPIAGLNFNERISIKWCVRCTRINIGGTGLVLTYRVCVHLYRSYSEYICRHRYIYSN